MNFMNFWRYFLIIAALAVEDTHSAQAVSLAGTQKTINGDNGQKKLSNVASALAAPKAKQDGSKTEVNGSKLMTAREVLIDQGADESGEEFGKQMSNEDEALIVRKEKEAKKLVREAVAYFMQDEVTVSEACYSFMSEQQWRRGELVPFVISHEGACYAYGDFIDALWIDMNTVDRISGQPLVVKMIKEGRLGGFIDFDWAHGLQHSYVKSIEKDGKGFIIGAGYFPESARYTTEQLVLSAIDHLLENGVAQTFASINDQQGIFVRGNIYLYAYTVDGDCVAHGENRALVNQNVMTWKEGGRERHREMIEFARQNGRGWFEYQDKGTSKEAFLALVNDPVTKKSYVIGGGYYPDIDDDSVLQYVKGAVSYLKSHGKEDSVVMFSGRSMLFGSLRLFMCDLEGNVLADSETPEFVGQNLLGLQDSDGKYIMRMMLEKAKKFERGWVSYLSKNAYKMVYLERVTIPGGTYIVGSGYFPDSKDHWTKSMVEKAADMLKSGQLEEFVRSVSRGTRDFLRGDIYISVYDQQGFSLATGPFKQKVWQDNLKQRKDAHGKSLDQLIIPKASAGGGWLEYDHVYGLRRAYVRGVEIENKITKKVDFYIVGAGYFL